MYNPFIGFNAHCTDIQKYAPGITVNLTKNMKMEATHTDLLNIPNIPTTARKCHLFSDMVNKALVFISKFCDNGYSTTFTAQILILQHDIDPSQSFEGARNERTGMWYINLAPHKHATKKRTRIKHTNHRNKIRK